MTAALRYEWRRITSIRSTWILLAIAILLALAFVTLFGMLINSAGGGASDGGGVGTSLTSILNFSISNFLVWVPLGTIAAQAFGQEYRNGTIRLTLTAFPRRDQVFWAKSIVCLAVIVVAMVVASIFGVIILYAVGVSDGGQSTLDIGFYLLRSCINLMGFCLIVFGVTLITRVLALGVVIPLLFSVVFEGVIVPAITVAVLGTSSMSETGFNDEAAWWLKILPFRAGSNFADGTDVVQNGLVYLAWVVIITGVGYVLFKRRDA